MKERSVDIEIKLERPDKEEFIEGYDGAQFKVSFPKEYNLLPSIIYSPI